MSELKFIAISGTTGVTENLYVYEYGNDIIVLDCGVGFPEEATYGVDLIIPDFSYLIKNKNKIRGVFISHGHEDHFGAIPFFFDQVGDFPVYASRLVAAFVKEKLDDYKIRGKNISIIDPDGEGVWAGAFRVDAFRVTHSVPDSLGFCITTPVGKFFHVSDYKFDWTPVDGKQFDLAKAAQLAKGGVVALASDSLGATSEGYTKSEKEIEQNIEVIMEGAKGAVFFTTISSNISRIQQAINISKRLGRKVVFVGRSIDKKAEIAKSLGFLNNEDVVVSHKAARSLPGGRVTYIISGTYGQVGSALYRVAQGEHEFLKVKEGDVVIFSSDPAPPGTEQTVNFVVDRLIEKGTEVHYYDTQEDLHVSGHGSQKEIEMLFALVRPRYFLPIGGTIRHMRGYKTLAGRMGFDTAKVFELVSGESVEFGDKGALRGKKIPVRDILVDGLGVGDVGEVVLSDRKLLAKEGILVVALRVDKTSGRILEKPRIISRGFVFAKKQQGFLDRVSEKVFNELGKREFKTGDIKGDFGLLRDAVVGFLEEYLFTETGRRPMILPVVVEV